MSRVPLSDAENRAILTDTFGDSLRGLGDASRQESVLKTVHKVVASSSPGRFVHETPTGCDTLDVFWVERDLRLYGFLAMGYPASDETYNILYCFYIDEHNYYSRDLDRFDNAAKDRARKLEQFEDPEALTAYLEDQNAFNGADLEERIDRV